MILGDFMKHLIRLALPILLVLVLFNGGTPAYAQLGLTTRLMVSGNEFNTGASFPSISNDGRFIVFESDSTNVVANDTNSATDIFWYNTQTMTYTRVSVSSANVQGNGNSTMPIISGNGRYVVFRSDANNLTSNDSNGYSDVFLRDMQTNTTTLISVNSTGNPLTNTVIITPDDISSDGRYVVMVSDSSEIVPNDTNNSWDIFLYDRQTGTTSRVSVNGNGDQLEFGAVDGKLSDDGRYLAFSSTSSNVVANDTNNAPDAFIKDLQTGQVTRVSVDSSGNQATYLPAMPFPGPFPFLIVDDISADGRYVTFASNATNLVANDTNEYVWDQFFHDSQTGQTKRISINNDGTQADDLSGGGVISDDGRYVFFESGATTLVANDTNNAFDVFMFDNQTNSLSRISLTSAGGQTDGDSGLVALSANMRYVVIASFATNIVANDTNGLEDIFIYDRNSLPAPTLIAPQNSLTTFSNNLTFSWNAMVGVTQYEIQISVSSGFSPILYTNTVATTTDSYIFTQVGTYYWRVRARNGAIIGAWSAVRSLTIQNAPEPILLSPTNNADVTNPNVTFTWEPINGITQYQIVISRTAWMSDVVVDQIVNTTSYTMTLPQYTFYARAYYWYVLAWDSVNRKRSAIRTLHYEPIPFSSDSLTRLGVPNERVFYKSNRDTFYFTTASNPQAMIEYDFYGDVVRTIPIQINLQQLPNSPISYSVTDITQDGRYMTVVVIHAIDNGIMTTWPRVYVYDSQTHSMTRILDNPDLSYIFPSAISEDGRYILLITNHNFSPQDTHNEVYQNDLYLYDRQTAQTRFISNVPSQVVTYVGRIPFATISPDGQTIAFLYSPSGENYGYLYTYNTQTNILRAITAPNNGLIGVFHKSTGNNSLRFSDNNRYLIFSSDTNNIVPNDTLTSIDAFVYDFQTNQFTLVSVNSDEQKANTSASADGISPDGRFVTFYTSADNIVQNDSPNTIDLFVRDLQSGQTYAVSQGNDGYLLQMPQNYYPFNSVFFNNNQYIMFMAYSDYYLRTFASPTIPLNPDIISNGMTTTINSTLSWDWMFESNRYELQIATDDAFTNIIHTDNYVHAMSYEYTFPSTGTYYWRVRGVNQLGAGDWSVNSHFIGIGGNALLDEQQLFNAMQPHLTNGITFALFDVTANGIMTTLQFSDGAVVTGTIKLVTQNGLLRISVESISGGSATQQAIMSDTLPSFIMTALDEVVPSGYLAIESVSMTSSAVDLGVVLPNP